jgi:sugar phosphate permease
MCISVALPYIARDMHLSAAAMGIVLSAFFLGYTLIQIPGGILADKWGARKIMTIALVWWSLFTAVTGAVVTMTQMLVARVIFGIGEGIYLGGSTKTVSVWFPRRERGAAMAIKLSATSLGTAITPPIVVAIMALWGWRAVFCCLCVPGLVMAILTWMYLRDRPSESKIISKDELNEIETDEATSNYGVSKSASIWDVMKVGVVWKIFLIYFFLDITMWGFSSWLPTYLVRVKGMTMAHMGIFASLPFIAGTLGMVLAGWAADKCFKNYRKHLVIGLELISAVLLYFMFTAETIPQTVIYQTIAGGTIWGTIGAFWALPMNIIPPPVMGTGGAFVNTGGQMAAFLSPMIVGFAVQSSNGNFNIAFLILIASAVISALIALTLKEPKAAMVSKMAG